MIRYSVTTKLNPAAVIGRAADYFSGELGLTIEEQSPSCATFEGGGGFVSVSAEQINGKTEVTVETREWDSQARGFIRKIT